MTARNTLASRDARALLRVANQLHELPADPVARKRHLLGALMRLTGASAAACVLSRREDGRRAAPVPVVQLGIAPRHRAVLDEFFATRRPPDPAAPPLSAAHRRQRAASPITCRRERLVADAVWYASPHVQEVRRPIGIDHCIYSIVPLPGRQVLGEIWISRGWGEKRRFTAREEQLVDLLHGEAAWIYDPDLPLVLPDAQHLAPRPAEVLRRLQAGHSEKQIAADMGLSRNTVHHYVKVIYKRFDVSTRSELMALFVQRR